MSGVDASKLVLEITETSVMSDAEYAMQVLNRLSAMGLTLAIDDFGTGYSSLSYLKRLPVDEVKIDKSFVLNMQDDENDAVIVRSIIDLAQEPRACGSSPRASRPTSAWDALRDMGCDIAQGYFISRPLPADQLDAWLETVAPAPAGIAAMTGHRPGSAHRAARPARLHRARLRAVRRRSSSDPEVVRYLDDGAPHQPGGLLAGHGAVHRALDTCGATAGGRSRTGSSGDFLGRIGLYNPEGWPGIEVGWLLAPRRLGRGLATEGATAALGFAFDVVGADHVISLIDPRNARSIRVAEKIGSRYEQNMKHGERPVVVYGTYRHRVPATR